MMSRVTLFLVDFSRRPSIEPYKTQTETQHETEVKMDTNFTQLSAVSLRPISRSWFTF